MLSSRAAGIRMETLSDDDLFRVIKEGGLAIGKSSQMAAWEGILSDQTIEDLVTYLRALAK
jgi:mono/diheme cytochrome c family protein